jgi:hypothetical protein
MMDDAAKQPLSFSLIAFAIEGLISRPGFRGPLPRTFLRYGYRARYARGVRAPVCVLGRLSHRQALDLSLILVRQLDTMAAIHSDDNHPDGYCAHVISMIPGGVRTLTCLIDLGYRS